MCGGFLPFASKSRILRRIPLGRERLRKRVKERRPPSPSSPSPTPLFLSHLSLTFLLPLPSRLLDLCGEDEVGRRRQSVVRCQESALSIPSILSWVWPAPSLPLLLHRRHVSLQATITPPTFDYAPPEEEEGSTPRYRKERESDLWDDARRRRKKGYLRKWKKDVKEKRNLSCIQIDPFILSLLISVSVRLSCRIAGGGEKSKKSLPRSRRLEKVGGTEGGREEGLLSLFPSPLLPCRVINVRRGAKNLAEERRKKEFFFSRRIFR